MEIIYLISSQLFFYPVMNLMKNLFLNLSLNIYSGIKKVLSFVGKWSDIVIFVPVAVLLFVFNQFWMGAIDPTAASMSPEFLSILNFNLVKFGFVFVPAYFVYNLYFHDFFKDGWEDKVKNTSVAAIIHLILWLTTLFASYKIITEGL